MEEIEEVKKRIRVLRLTDKEIEELKEKGIPYTIQRGMLMKKIEGRLTFIRRVRIEESIN